MITPSLPWYYVTVSSAAKSGPFTDAQIIEMFQQGVITAETLVWNQALPAWQQLSKSKLAGFLGLSAKNIQAAPPIPKRIPPPLRKNNEPSRKDRFTFQSIVGVLISIFILGRVGLFFFQQSSELKLGGSAGRQAVLAQYDADKAGSVAAQPNATPSSAQPEKISLTQATSVSSSSSTPAPTPEASPTSAQEVSSSNPVIYSGSFINQATGESGDLTLQVEHLLLSENNQIIFGGKLIQGSSSSSITGTYAPGSTRISFSPGVQSGVVWNALIEGDSMRGVFSRKIYNGSEGGIWQTKHSGGLSLQKAAMTAVASAPQVTIEHISQIDGTYAGNFFQSNLNTNRPFLITIKSTGQPGGTPAVLPIHGSMMFGDGRGDDGLNGTVTYSTNTTFTLGWNNTNGAMQFNGTLTNHEILGTWVLDTKNTMKMRTGTFDAAQSSNQPHP